MKQTKKENMDCFAIKLKFTLGLFCPFYNTITSCKKFKKKKKEKTSRNLFWG